MKAYFAAALVAGHVLAAAHAGAQDSDLSAARDLYASAAYDDALAVLNRLRFLVASNTIPLNAAEDIVLSISGGLHIIRWRRHRVT